MKSLSRYLIAELVRSSLLMLVGLLGLFMFFDLIGELRDVGHGSYTFAKLLFYVLLLAPGHAYELIPIAVLIGGIVSLSMLNQHSELTVMRVSGLEIWRLLKILISAGLIFTALTMAAGEYIAPKAERTATQLRLASKGQLVSQDFRSGFWLRDDGNFVNVREVLPDQTLRNIHIYRFSAGKKLESYIYAHLGKWDKATSSWQLSELYDTNYQPEQVKLQWKAAYAWNSVLTPNMLSSLQIAPEQMSIFELITYIDHLRHNSQKTSRYEIALWTKIIYPLACIAMLIIALPFAQTQRRAGGIGMKLMIGIMLGLGFYFTNKLVATWGLLYGWPPLLAATTPSAAFLLFALFLLWRQERR